MALICKRKKNHTDKFYFRDYTIEKFRSDFFLIYFKASENEFIPVGDFFTSLSKALEYIISLTQKKSEKDV